MKLFTVVSLGTFLVAISGCSQPPAPPVAQAYADQYGPAETSRFTPCPKVQGVWQLSNLSAGTLLREDGAVVPHFRWFGAKLFDLSVGTKSQIAIDPNPVETALYLSEKLAGSNRPLLSFSLKSDKELPCVGRGWRQVVSIDHSRNDAAARVLGLIPERPKKITQADYFARTATNDLLLAIRIDFQGTNTEQEPINTGYWHFLKMPRLHDKPKEHGFKN